MTEGPVSRSTQNLGRVIAHHGIDLVLDVGANLGQYALRLRAGGYGGRIVSFEPQSAVHDRLRHTAEADRLWTVAPRLALGADDRQVTLNLSAESDMSSVLDLTDEMRELLDSSAFVGSEQVPQARLDAVFSRFAGAGERVLLKIDTQGTERQVLDGATEALGQIRLIQLELSLFAVYRGEPSWRDLIDHLARLGFRPVLFIPGYFNRRTARLIGMDGVFARL